LILDGLWSLSNPAVVKERQGSGAVAFFIPTAFSFQKMSCFVKTTLLELTSLRLVSYASHIGNPSLACQQISFGESHCGNQKYKKGNWARQS